MKGILDDHNITESIVTQIIIRNYNAKLGIPVVNGGKEKKKWT